MNSWQLMFNQKPVEDYLDRLHQNSKQKSRFIQGLFQRLSWPKLLTKAAAFLYRYDSHTIYGISPQLAEQIRNDWPHHLNILQKMVKQGYHPSQWRSRHVVSKASDCHAAIHLPHSHVMGGTSCIHFVYDLILQNTVAILLQAIFCSPTELVCSLHKPYHVIRDLCRTCTHLSIPQMIFSIHLHTTRNQISHHHLMKQLTNKIHDQRFKAMIWRMLRMQVDRNGIAHFIQQGLRTGPLGDALWQIFCHEFDTKMMTAGTQHTTILQHSSASNFYYHRLHNEAILLIHQAIARSWYKQCQAVWQEVWGIELEKEGLSLHFPKKGFTFAGYRIAWKYLHQTFHTNDRILLSSPTITISKQHISYTKKRVTQWLRHASHRGYHPSTALRQVNSYLKNYYTLASLCTHARAEARHLYLHARMQFWFYLKRCGYTHRRRFVVRDQHGHTTLGLNQVILRHPSGLLLKPVCWR